MTETCSDNLIVIPKDSVILVTNKVAMSNEQMEEFRLNLQKAIKTAAKQLIPVVLVDNRLDVLGYIDTPKIEITP
jgi:hypothetical protein